MIVPFLRIYFLLRCKDVISSRRPSLPTSPHDYISVDEFLRQVPSLISMDAIEKKRRVQQLAESTLSPRKVLRLHKSGQRNIDVVEAKLQKPRLPKMRSQRRVKGLSAWSPSMLSDALAAKPSTIKAKPKVTHFLSI
jgi:hypothetical protein